jgi:hypothetical protein
MIYEGTVMSVDFDDGAYDSELLGFKTLSTILNSKNLGKKQRYGSYTCFRPQVNGSSGSSY